ncbi:response regulator receiver domain [Agarivorans sp. QJM3NY_33]|uniref:response regulator receiver domain n=1 Tax=Agarivorans sp. QJM3NY_33 TaxID=3421432 RepID=UPI003D7E57A7
MPSNASFDYTPFLKQAYLDPIRTVTVIDDEYPTLERLLNNDLANFESDDITRLKDVVQVCRSPENNWLLDVHDGNCDTASADSIANRLHHSDLLILDYHLDGEDDGLCQKTLDIISYLTKNQHFNLVAVHTKGYEDPNGGVNTVFKDIVISLTKYPELANVAPNLLVDVEAQLDEWGFEETDIRANLEGSISELQLLELIKSFNGDICKPHFNHEYFNLLDFLFEQKPQDVVIPKPLLIKWLCHQILSPLKGKFFEGTADTIDWGITDGNNWIKTNDLFLTVVGKKTTPVQEIPNKIIEAMAYWNPHPHKLILSKLRSEIEANGMSATSEILRKKHLQAAWLEKLLKSSNENEIKTEAWSTISKLWEELSIEMKGPLNQFTVELVKALKQSDESILASFIDSSVLSNKANQITHANCFSCSKSVSAHHLITGHILEFDQKYWLCLTPMCDLVPGQKSDGDSTKPMAIALVQMYDAKQAWKNTQERMREILGVDKSALPKLSNEDEMSKILDYSTQNNLVFIKPNKLNPDIKILSFTVGLDGSANPKAQEFFAENQGVFDSSTQEITLHSANITSNSSARFEEKVHQGKVVAELRYEYAINLLMRLGFAKSRVGLDFVSSN